MSAHAKTKRPELPKPPRLFDIPPNGEVCRDENCQIMYLHAAHPIGSRRGRKVRPFKMRSIP